MQRAVNYMRDTARSNSVLQQRGLQTPSLLRAIQILTQKQCQQTQRALSRICYKSLLSVFFARASRISGRAFPSSLPSSLLPGFRVAAGFFLAGHGKLGSSPFVDALEILDPVYASPLCQEVDAFPFDMPPQGFRPLLNVHLLTDHTEMTP